MHFKILFNEDLTKIFKLLNYEARLVGGCVRDFLLNFWVADDIDIATPLLPEEVKNLLENDFNLIPTGLEHGTITIVSKCKKYEITTLRKDVKTNGRHADVVFHSSYEEDAKRRDFTINALYLDFDGNLYDYFDGQTDLKNRYVKFIGNAKERICEDYLRILRFFRFSMRFGNIDENGLACCNDLKEGLLKISKERLTSEWFNLMKGSYFFKFLHLFYPVMETLKFDVTKKIPKNFDQLSKLGITAFFIQENTLLRLSNQEKKYIKNLHNLILNTQAQANLIFNKNGKEFFLDKSILEGKIFDLIEISAIPIQGQDLINLGYTGKEIGLALDKLESIWYSKAGKISKEELLKYLNGK